MSRFKPTRAQKITLREKERERERDLGKYRDLKPNPNNGFGIDLNL